MNQIYELIEVLEQFLSNPWLLAFAGVWIVGYMLKEKSPINNQLIPWIVLAVAIVLGVVIIEQSLAGAIVGGLIGYIQIGFYEHIKNSIGFLKEYK